MIKQFIITRCDLKLRKGAIGAQIEHAGLLFIMERVAECPVIERHDDGGVVVALSLDKDEFQWLRRPSNLVVLRAETKEQFLDIERQLGEAGLYPYVWTEEDLNDEPTAMAVGPLDEELARPILGGLKLLQ